MVTIRRWFRRMNGHLPDGSGVGASVADRERPHCLQYGSQPMTSSVVANPNGTKTVTFQCGLR